MTADIQLTPKDERVIERAARLHLYHTLASLPETRSPRVLPSMVSDYVDGTHPDTDGAIAKALRTELPLRRLYRNLLERRTVAKVMLVQLAAATQDESKLVLDRGILHWQEMQGRDRQILVLRLHEDVCAGQSTRPVLHLEWNEGFGRIDFPEVIDGTTQYVLASDDRRMRRLIADATRTQPDTRYRIVLI